MSVHATATNFETAKYILSNGMIDHYEVLGVDDDASTHEIKRAYRCIPGPCYHGTRHHCDAGSPMLMSPFFLQGTC
jgi:hypothetical protein